MGDDKSIVEPSLPTIELKVKFEGTVHAGLFGEDNTSLDMIVTALTDLGINCDTLTVNQITLKKNGVLS